MIAQLFYNLRENVRSGMKSLLPLLILVIYTLIGAFIFIWLEGGEETNELEALKRHRAEILENTAFRLNNIKSMSPVQAYNHTIKQLLRYQDKLGVDQVPDTNQHWTLSGAIFFCITVYTTIGYGNIVPVTLAGRIVTILYAFIGIPLTVLALYSLGQLIAKLFRLIWKAFLKTTRVVSKDLSEKVAELGEAANSDNGSAQGNGKDEDDLSSFPVSIICLITIIWVLISSLIFMLIETDWDYGTALYFALISFTTIGFGDVLPSKYSYMIFIGIMILFGLALVSSTLAIIQQQIENLGDNMKSTIDKEYLNALAEAEDEGEITASKAVVTTESPENVDVEAHIATMDPRSLDAVVARMPLKSRLLYHIMPAGSKKQLQSQNEARMATRSRHTQTDETLLQDLVASMVEEELLKLKLAQQDGGGSPSAPASPASPSSPAPAYETSLQ